MIKKTSTSFRSIGLGILVLPLTNLPIAQDHISKGKVVDVSTKVAVTSVVANATNNIIQRVSFGETLNIARVAPYLFSHHSI